MVPFVILGTRTITNNAEPVATLKTVHQTARGGLAPLSLAGAITPATKADRIRPSLKLHSPGPTVPGDTTATGISTAVAINCTSAARFGPSQVPHSNAAAGANENDPSVYSTRRNAMPVEPSVQVARGHREGCKRLTLELGTARIVSNLDQSRPMSTV